MGKKGGGHVAARVKRAQANKRPPPAASASASSAAAAPHNHDAQGALCTCCAPALAGDASGSSAGATSPAYYYSSSDTVAIKNGQAIASGLNGSGSKAGGGRAASSSLSAAAASSLDAAGGYDARTRVPRVLASLQPASSWPPRSADPVGPELVTRTLYVMRRLYAQHQDPAREGAHEELRQCVLDEQREAEALAAKDKGKAKGKGKDKGADKGKGKADPEAGPDADASAAKPAAPEYTLAQKRSAVEVLAAALDPDSGSTALLSPEDLPRELAFDAFKNRNFDSFMQHLTTSVVLTLPTLEEEEQAFAARAEAASADGELSPPPADPPLSRKLLALPVRERRTIQQMAAIARAFYTAEIEPLLAEEGLRTGDEGYESFFSIVWEVFGPQDEEGLAAHSAAMTGPPDPLAGSAGGGAASSQAMAPYAPGGGGAYADYDDDEALLEDARRLRTHSERAIEAAENTVLKRIERLKRDKEAKRRVAAAAAAAKAVREEQLALNDLRAAYAEAGDPDGYVSAIASGSGSGKGKDPGSAGPAASSSASASASAGSASSALLAPVQPQSQTQPAPPAQPPSVLQKLQQAQDAYSQKRANLAAVAQRAAEAAQKAQQRDAEPSADGLADEGDYVTDEEDDMGSLEDELEDDGDSAWDTDTEESVSPNGVPNLTAATLRAVIIAYRDLMQLYVAFEEPFDAFVDDLYACRTEPGREAAAARRELARLVPEAQARLQAQDLKDGKPGKKADVVALMDADTRARLEAATAAALARPPLTDRAMLKQTRRVYAAESCVEIRFEDLVPPVTEASSGGAEALTPMVHFLIAYLQVCYQPLATLTKRLRLEPPLTPEEEDEVRLLKRDFLDMLDVRGADGAMRRFEAVVRAVGGESGWKTYENYWLSQWLKRSHTAAAVPFKSKAISSASASSAKPSAPAAAPSKAEPPRAGTVASRSVAAAAAADTMSHADARARARARDSNGDAWRASAGLARAYDLDVATTDPASGARKASKGKSAVAAAAAAPPASTVPRADAGAGEGLDQWQTFRDQLRSSEHAGAAASPAAPLPSASDAASAARASTRQTARALALRSGERVNAGASSLQGSAAAAPGSSSAGKGNAAGAARPPLGRMDSIDAPPQLVLAGAANLYEVD